MKTLTLLCIPIASFGSGCATRRDEPSMLSGRERFVGTWRLVSWCSGEDVLTNRPYGPDARGLLLYTGDGRMSVFLSQADRPAFARAEAESATTGEKATAIDFCFAYTGTHEVAEGRVTHRIEHRIFPNWIGALRVRFVRFDGDRLIPETPPLPAGDRPAVSRLVRQKWSASIP